LSEEFLNLINSRLILIYTGITRLAKDLLLNVIRNWYAISDEIYENVQDLVKNAHECSKAIESGNYFYFKLNDRNINNRKLLFRKHI
jgi:fucokinase